MNRSRVKGQVKIQVEGIANTRLEKGAVRPAKPAIEPGFNSVKPLQYYTDEGLITLGRRASACCALRMKSDSFS